MLFLSLQGSPYDVGFQHGQQLRRLIYRALRKRCRFFHSNRRPDHTVLRTRAKALERHFPELMAEVRGIADGAGVLT